MDKIYLDTDVLVSSQISKSGAAYKLIYENSQTEMFISNLSYEEYEKVCLRLGLDFDKELTNVSQIKAVSDALNGWQRYLSDKADVHVLLGCVESDSRFLITYNTSDYTEHQIKADLGTLIMTPGSYLQYLRTKKS